MPELLRCAYIFRFVMSQNALTIALDRMCPSVLVLKGQTTFFSGDLVFIPCFKGDRNPSCSCSIKLSVLANL